MSGGVAPADPVALIRSRQYRVLLVLAALVGLLVSAASWCFLEAVHELEVWVYEDLPTDLGYEHVPLWWPLPWLALAGLADRVCDRAPAGTRRACARRTGSRPVARRLGPIDLPGVLLAALATLGLGLVLGPEGPLIAVGDGLGTLAMWLGQAGRAAAGVGSDGRRRELRGGLVDLRLAGDRRGAADRGDRVSADRSCRSCSCPGLMAAGIGSLVFIGLGSWSGLSTAAWSLSPFPLPPFGGPRLGRLRLDDPARRRRRRRRLRDHGARPPRQRVVGQRTFVLTIVAGLAVGGLAIAFAQTTDYYRPPCSSRARSPSARSSPGVDDLARNALRS